MSSSHDHRPSINNVLDLLAQQFVVISGGKTREGYSIITFPDIGNFVDLSEEGFEKLISYTTSVPSLQEADLGFVIIVDRRNDKWSSVRCVLLRLAEFFPGLLHVVYVIRPNSFFQKAISEVSNKFFKEDFKFKVVVCSIIEELHEYIDNSELTVELSGTLPYFHQHWIQQRMALENFSNETNEVSSMLNEFTERLTNDTLDLPDTKEQSADLLCRHAVEYGRLKKCIAEAVKKGESLLGDFKQDTDTYHGSIPSTVTNVAALERLLVQMEETEKVFDDFWEQFSGRLKQCHSLRAFEESFNIVQSSLNEHLKILSEMTDVGDSVDRVESLLEEFTAFQKSSYEKIKLSEDLLHCGGQLLASKRFIVLESIQPKCDEVQRLIQTLNDRLEKRLQTLNKSCELQARIQKASEWCAKGVMLLGSEPPDKCISAEQSLAELEEFMSSAHHLKVESPREFYSLFEDTITPETKPIVTQVLQRLDDVTTMCDKRLASLKRLINKPRPILSVNPEPAIPIHLTNMIKISNDVECDSGIQNEESNVTKTKHVLSELLCTERQYTTELGSILRGYKDQMEVPDMKNLIPTGLKGKSEVLFGNLESIHSFHNQFFLPALESCSSSTESVAVCFTDNREKLLQLYTYYCVNLTRSEEIREVVGEDNAFFKLCQEKLGHRLPLGAYLLLPMQRITKYQLLLKELLHSEKNQNCITKLQKALDCMLLVLNNVNDNMHQIGITGFYGDWNDLGGLLLQGSFSVWVENKKDLLKELRLKPMRRQIFLYQQGLLLCKKVSKDNKPMYHFKKYLRMCNIGLTETVKGDLCKFEVWLEGRQEVYTIQASNLQQKQQWVSEIKRVLLEQLAELKGEKIKQYINTFGKHVETGSNRGRRPLSHHETTDDDSSDYSLTDDESLDGTIKPKADSYISLADYNALRPTDATLKRGDKVDLLKAGSSSWWYVKIQGSKTEGWVPAAHLEVSGRKSSHSSQSVCSHGSTSTE
ncbi:guanine nucleotide exchange factor DBS-like isoform X2 [Sipha flava]|uniref:Guanine nucleotide exchange factor DBS-like isoform X2 n=2 Tax=Sipha flava TaxID=143950 RepID=A0A8B8F912_9HEMI|nr:guanine nucleotide exchange factor DBS-like isoform X2 [Sipha flava]